MNTIVNKYGYSAECNVDILNENSRGTAIVWRDGLPISDINIIDSKAHCYVFASVFYHENISYISDRS